MKYARRMRAARALLGWSQEELAQASGVSTTTICHLEKGVISPRPSTDRLLRTAMETSGLEFIEPDGVRFRSEECVVYQGQDSCERLMDNIVKTIGDRGGEVIASFVSHLAFSKFLSDPSIVERFPRFTESTKVNMLTTKPFIPDAHAKSVSFRLITKDQASPTSFFTYGDKLVVVLEEGATLKFLVITAFDMAQVYRTYFYRYWNDALPLSMSINQQDEQLVVA